MTGGVFSETFPEVRVAVLSILDFWQKQFGAFFKTAFYERWGSFWKRVFFEKIFSLFFGFGSNISGIFSKIFLIGWPNCRWKSPGELFEKKVFFWKKSSLSDVETKTFGKGQFSSAAFSKLHKTWPEKHPKDFFLRFGDLFSHSRTFSRNKRLSELLSMGPEDSFEKRKIFKIRVFFYTFWT